MPTCWISYYSKARTNVRDIEKEKKRNLNKIVTVQKDISFANETIFLKKQGKLNKLNNRMRTFINHHTINAQYSKFTIPKATGGVREITAPNPALKDLQHAVVDFLVNDLKVLSHNAAHGFVCNRNTKSALQVHQATGARWFLKLDIHDFFNSIRTDTVVQALSNTYPLAMPGQEQFIVNVSRLACYNGHLPQGAPTSPILSNIVMIPVDVAITKALPTLTYTRYADDLLFSSATHFDVGFVLGEVRKILKELTPNLFLNPKKIRYGSCNGSNWNLGLMYNKDLALTVGYKQKKLIKNRVHNYIRDYSELDDKTERISKYYELLGLINYYKYIEPNYFTPLLAQWKQQGFKFPE